MQAIVEDVNSAYSPSFSSYFNPNLADVVTRVTSELDDADFEFNLSNLDMVGGDIQHVYPTFDRDLVYHGDQSSLSSESDDPEEIPTEMLCFWIPKKSDFRCTKSNSTGSEKVKVWKLRDLLKRSKSDGKEEGRVMLLTPKKKAKMQVVTEKKRKTYLPYRQNLFGLFVTPQRVAK